MCSCDLHFRILVTCISAFIFLFVRSLFVVLRSSLIFVVFWFFFLLYIIWWRKEILKISSNCSRHIKLQYKRPSYLNQSKNITIPTKHFLRVLVKFYQHCETNFKKLISRFWFYLFEILNLIFTTVDHTHKATVSVVHLKLTELVMQRCPEKWVF